MGFRFPSRKNVTTTRTKQQKFHERFILASAISIQTVYHKTQTHKKIKYLLQWFQDMVMWFEGFGGKTPHLLYF